MELDEIRQRLAAVEGELARWGLDLSESFNLDRDPSAICIQAGVVIEKMFRDLWKRLKLKGPPDKKQFEDLLTLTSKKLEEDGEPIPIEILTDIRDIQLRRNQAAHHWNANRRVAVGILGSLADVMTWYFVAFLPLREEGQSKEGNPQEIDPGQKDPPRMQEVSRKPEVTRPPAAPPMWTSLSTGMKFALIPAGDFEMGSADGDYDEKPPHPVKISKPFYLGIHEVTQGEYKKVMGNNPSWFSAGGGGKDNVAGQSTDRHPVEQVSWKEAIAFCNKLSERDGLKPYYRSEEGEPLGGDGYRLPTEAEWEYACRAGSTTKYSFGDDESLLKQYAWYDESFSTGKTHPVGQKQPNAFGLYDMHGNVWEWCWDWFGGDYYNKSSNIDPINANPGTDRVLRGGSWDDVAAGLRSSDRGGIGPALRYGSIGFRLARTYH
jgi:formylglycine-generating enzyme required for sulfatase activity